MLYRRGIALIPLPLLPILEELGEGESAVRGIGVCVGHLLVVLERQVRPMLSVGVGVGVGGCEAGDGCTRHDG